MMNAFEIQRELLTVEEKFVAVREAFRDYASDAQEVLNKFDKVQKEINELQQEMREWFA
jgi:DNA repair ATPase RecN